MRFSNSLHFTFKKFWNSYIIQGNWINATVNFCINYFLTDFPDSTKIIKRAARRCTNGRTYLKYVWIGKRKVKESKFSETSTLCIIFYLTFSFFGFYTGHIGYIICWKFLLQRFQCCLTNAIVIVLWVVHDQLNAVYYSPNSIKTFVHCCNRLFKPNSLRR